jgi:hypothetical protein
MIVFGWNHFRLKSFSARELNLPDDESGSIEVRQKYFHLFWIPFFAIGKKWVIKRNNKLYELPIEYEAYLDSHAFKVRTPWYAFAGPLLLIFGVIVGNIVSVIDEKIEHGKSEARFEKEMDVLHQKFVMAKTSDYFKLAQIKRGGEAYPLLQVLEVRPQEIVFKRLVTRLDSYELSDAQLQSIFSNPVMIDTIRLSKEKLAKTVERKYNSQFAGADLFDDGSEYITSVIFRPTVTVQ